MRINYSNFYKGMTLLLQRECKLIITVLIIFSQNTYSLQEQYRNFLHHKCQTAFSSIKAIQPKSKRLQKEKKVILSKAVKYQGPKGYEIYIQEYPNSLLSDFQNALALFSIEELELLEWHYIEFDSINFAKIISIREQTVTVDHIDNENFKTKILNRSQLRTIRPSSTAQRRTEFRKALERMNFTEDERYISILLWDLGEADRYYQYGRILEVQDGAVVAEVIEYNGRLRKTQLSQKHLFKAEINPASKTWFNRMEQAIEILEPLTIIEEHTEDYTHMSYLRRFEEHKEEDLIKKGYKKVLTEGVNEANRLIELGEHIRQSNINPFSTHIIDFALQIPDHIEVIRKGIKSQGVETEEQLQLLKQFEQEAYRKIKKKAVTYAWWIYWNKRLSILITPSHQREEKGDWWTSEENMEHFLDNFNEEQLRAYYSKEYQLIELISQFPDQIILPTISDLGVIALNQSSVHSVYPVQLAGTAQWKDGQLKTPENFFSHDIIHAVEQFQQNDLSLPPFFMKSFYRQVEAESDLTPYEREVIEIIYFLIEHESQKANINQPQTIIDMMLNKDMQSRFQNTNDLRGWVQEDIKERSLKSHLHEIAKIFNRSSASILKRMKLSHQEQNN